MRCICPVSLSARALSSSSTGAIEFFVSHSRCDARQQGDNESAPRIFYCSYFLGLPLLLLDIIGLQFPVLRYSFLVLS
jgi:hypothetical protein